MRRYFAQAAWGVLVGSIGWVSACSKDNAAPPSTADGGAAGIGTSGHAGTKASSGNGSGAMATGGVSGAEGGAAQEGGMTHEGGNGAETAVGGAGANPDGGAGGEAAVVVAGPPDLIVSNGGPWPDSLTGSCGNTKSLIPCPQKDDAFFGQDGTYRINVPSYTATATTLKDSVTKLMWQLKPEQVEKTQADAAAYCDGLDLGGQTDWRLPTRLEYISVLDEGLGAGYALPPAMPIDSTGAYWTASTTGTTVGGFFVLDDGRGTWTVAIGTTSFLARCVRGAPLTGALTVDTDVVTDTMTNLAWQVSDLDDTARNWQEALDYCETLNHADKDDWRLPSIKELATLVDETVPQAPVIAADFGATTAKQYWSSTPTLSFGSERFAFAVELRFGGSESLKMTDRFAAARCVRTAD